MSDGPSILIKLARLMTLAVCMTTSEQTQFTASEESANRVCPSNVRMATSPIGRWQCALLCAADRDCQGWVYKPHHGDTCYTCGSVANLSGSETPIVIFWQKSDCDPAIAHVDGPYGVPDDSLTATSHWDGHDAYYAKMTKRGWASAIDKTIGTYLQVAFGTLKIVTEICIQGIASNDQYVTRYNVTYSNDCDTFHYVLTNNGHIQEFNGNSNGLDIDCSRLTQPAMIKCIRIIPTAYNNHMSMHVELFGC